MEQQAQQQQQQQQHHQQGYHGMIVVLDQGFQSFSLSDVLATVMNCANYVDEMPFPTLVNAVLIRLAEAFQGEKLSPKLEQFLNVIRFSIVKAVREFRRHLHVAFSSDEIVRCVMKVSHSNDFNARSLTLLFLAALAPLVSENTKAHHLLIESLDCHESTELSAAIYAATEFGRHSSAFCVLVVEKLTEVLCSNQAPIDVKIQLLNVMANFRESLNVTRACLRLANTLLQSSYNVMLHIAIYNTSTTLAVRCRPTANEQITLFLNELRKPTINNMIMYCLLKNLARLAEFPAEWTSQQLQDICECQELIHDFNSRKVVCAWLKCMEVLAAAASTTRGADADRTAIIERNFSWIALLRGNDLMLRVSGLSLLLRLMEHTATKYLCGIFMAVIADTIRDLFVFGDVPTGATTTKYAAEFRTPRRQFFKLIGTFAQIPLCSTRKAFLIVREITSNLSKAICVNFGVICREPVNQELLELGLQTLCAICDAHTDACAPFVTRWALDRFLDVVRETEKSKNTGGFCVPFAFYNLILLPVYGLFAASDSPPSAAPGAATSSLPRRDGESVSAAVTRSASVESMDAELTVNELVLVDAVQSDEQLLHSQPSSLPHKQQRRRGGEMFLAAIRRLLLTQHNSNGDGGEDWTRYRVARCAMRYGHHADVAVPLLERVAEQCETLESSSWISALMNVARSQFSGGEGELTVNELNESYRHLRNAHLIFQRLAASPQNEQTRCFAFASAYTDCVAMTWHAVRVALSTLNVRLLCLPPVDEHHNAPLGRNDAGFCVEQLAASLLTVKNSVAAAADAWSALYRRSFDADAATLQQLTLWITFLHLLENLLLFMAGQPMRPLDERGSCAVSDDDEGDNADGVLPSTSFINNTTLTKAEMLEALKQNDDAEAAETPSKSKLQRRPCCAANHCLRATVAHFRTVFAELIGRSTPTSSGFSRADASTASKRPRLASLVVKEEVGGDENNEDDSDAEDVGSPMDGSSSRRSRRLSRRLSTENLLTLRNLLLNLKDMPLCLPRHFFQRAFRTIIKLNILPQAQDAESNSIHICTALLPLAVEGVIQTDNPSRIRRVTVVAEMTPASAVVTSTSKIFTDQRTIELDLDENYFKAQFLMKVNESSTKIRVKLLFHDAVTRRQWVDESAAAELNVQFVEATVR